MVNVLAYFTQTIVTKCNWCYFYKVNEDYYAFADLELINSLTILDGIYKNCAVNNDGYCKHLSLV